MPQQLEEKALFSAKDQKNYRLVPDISVDHGTTIYYEGNPSDSCSFWDNTYFPRQTVSCLIKRETSTSCYFTLPNIIDGMNKIDLLDLDSFHAISNDLPYNIKEEPMEEDIRVDFLNIKDVYFKHAEGTEDSFLCVYVKTGRKVNGVKLYLKQFQDGLSGHCSHGPICLPSEYNRRTGMLSVDLKCLSQCLPPSSETTDCLKNTSSFWQFIAKVQLEDGRSVCHFSKSFQIRRNIQEYEDEKGFKTKLRQIPISRMDASSICLSSSLYSSNIEELSDSMPKSCALESIRNSKFKPFPCQDSVFSDDTTSKGVLDYGTKKIALAPGSTLDKSVISTKIQDQNDIVSIQEQANFAGLLKVMKTNHLQETSRRKANGYRSAEEAFVWACGYCFFSRGKKSTVKSHVSRQVCQKRRRMLSECSIRQEKTVKPKFRRCHTFSGIQSKPMRNYSLKRCKTP
ncbi:uncharacterized protein LOC116290799 isoform X2 [Actinia tenebrosa]|nr:uncharacterized protein LOC116290799 isoform X2 [Actinia tenebrosa]